MKDLSRQELKQIKGGVAPVAGDCVEECGCGTWTESCSSNSGDCSRNGDASITCDGETTLCPQCNN